MFISLVVNTCKQLWPLTFKKRGDWTWQIILNWVLPQFQHILLGTLIGKSRKCLILWIIIYDTWFMRHLAIERWSLQISQTYGEWIWIQEKSQKIIMIRVKKFSIGNLSVSCHMKFSFTRQHMMKIGSGFIWDPEVGRIWSIWYHPYHMDHMVWSTWYIWYGPHDMVHMIWCIWYGSSDRFIW